jgi:DNA-binding NarL/FixJ family response regulator
VNQPDGNSDELQPDSIHILIANMPGVLSQLIVQLIAQQSDMLLIGLANDPLETLAAAREADIVILGANLAEPPPPICSHLLSEYPNLRILVLSTQSDTLVGYWMGLRHKRLKGGTAQQVLRSIRKVYDLETMT